MRLRINGEFVVGVVAVILGLIAGALLMVATGNDAMEGYEFLFKGGLMNLERVGNTLATATPLILTGLSVAFAFRTGLFNIGTDVVIGVGVPPQFLNDLLALDTQPAGVVGGVVRRDHRGPPQRISACLPNRPNRRTARSPRPRSPPRRRPCRRTVGPGR